MKHAPVGSPEFNRIREAIRDLGRRSIRPILEIEEGSGGRRPSGTALIIRQHESAAFFTAAHTVSGPTGKLIALGEDKATRWPRDYSTIGGGFSAIPPLEVAYTSGELDKDLTQLIPGITRDSFATAEVFSSRASFIAMGYPASKAKYSYSDSTLATQLLSVTCSEAPDSVYAELKLDRRFHLAVGYNRDAVSSVEGARQRGARAKGMSGGGLFIPMQDEQTGEVKLFLAGILTQHHEAPHNVLVAARIDAIWDALGL